MISTGNSLSVLASPPQFKSGTHGPCPRLRVIGGMVGGVGGSKAFRNQNIDRVTHQFAPVIAKDPLQLIVHSKNASFRVRSQGGIGRRLEQSFKSYLMRLFSRLRRRFDARRRGA